jgi:hypothetical protein
LDTWVEVAGLAVGGAGVGFCAEMSIATGLGSDMGVWVKGTRGGGAAIVEVEVVVEEASAGLPYLPSSFLTYDM